MQTCDSYCPEAELPVTDTCIVCGRVGCGAGMDFNPLKAFLPFFPLQGAISQNWGERDF